MIAILACSLLLIALIAGIYVLGRALDEPRGRHAYGAARPYESDESDESAQFPGLIDLPRRDPLPELRVPPYLPSPGEDDTVTDLAAIGAELAVADA